MNGTNFTYPQNVSFECNRCGLCCGDTKEKTRHILLLQKEAEEISQHTSTPIQDFASSQTDNKPYVFEMKKPSQGRCFFLKNSQCAIYNQRPLICRFYPFELKYQQDQDAHVFTFTLECPTINKGKPLTKKDFQELFLLAQEKFKAAQEHPPAQE